MIRIMLAAALAVSLPAMGFAQSVQEKRLLSGKDVIDPDSGYIYVSGPVTQTGMFLRLPDEEAIAAYQKDWDAAFAKAREKYPRDVRRWELGVEMARRNLSRVPEKPIEPTEANFTIGPIELRDKQSFGPQSTYTKAKDPAYYGYLIKVRPGRYAYYGEAFVAVNGVASGTCACMGSVAFDVKPGMITDTGNFFLAAAGPDPDFPNDAPGDGEAGLYRPGATRQDWGGLVFGLPASLQGYKHAKADFHGYGKVDNFFGITISRMPPIPGVLAYDRDKAIDLNSGVPDAPAPTVASAPEGATAAANEPQPDEAPASTAG